MCKINKVNVVEIRFIELQELRVIIGLTNKQSIELTGNQRYIQQTN